MKLASFRHAGGPTWGMVDGNSVSDLGPSGAGLATHLAGALASCDAAAIRGASASAPHLALEAVTWLPVIPAPAKILCVGLNYETHRREAGRAETEHPTIFLRLARSQAGHGAPIVRPRVSDKLDYEGELAVIIGEPGRYIAEADAMAHVAGYACYNDATVRDWQQHTHQFTPGKNFDQTGAFGPWMTTADEVGDLDTLRLTTEVNGARVQDALLEQMIFPVERLIAYCSAFTRLEPGDVIATGTPGGVGFKRDPPLFLSPGDEVAVEITGVGRLVNVVRDEAELAAA